MYAIKPIKPPAVRPRSSLSTTDERQHRKNNKMLITLAGISAFLLVLCVFLLGALVYVGRTIANDKLALTADKIDSPAENDNHTQENIQYTQTKPIRLRQTPISSQKPTHPITIQYSSKLPTMASKSKVLQQLSYRLPSQYLRPEKYKLRLFPDLLRKTFTGNISISLKVIKPISFIPLHSKNLNVSTKAMQQVDCNGTLIKNLTPSLTYEFKDYEYWVTEFAEPLEVGNYTMSLVFNGSMTNSIVGLYQSSYFDEKRNEKRWMATSKFEPTFARLAFPCFDEPAMKAMFTVTIVRPTGDGYRALSNMDIVDEVHLGDVTEVHFAESVPMSTYLACFIVSDFDYKGKMVRGMIEGSPDFELRVYSTPAQVDKVDYSLDIAVGITEYYIQYFNISYPLPKLDLAAIPDFVSGATEHWGLITFREAVLLYDHKISSSSNKQRVAHVVAHELAHMWFGNLVTMKWWNDLWLNEGFASYIECKGVNEMHPDWGVLDQFIIDNLQPVMNLDATLASHPIVQVVENPNQITELFDTITYSKGSSIVRMLEDLVGEEVFRTAVSNYLNNFMYQNAETDDFLSEFEALELSFDVKLILQTWTEQMGLPVVECIRSGNTYKLTQKRFFSNPEDYNGYYDDSQFNYHWSIPITYFTSSSREVQRAIFNYNDQELTINLPEPVDWIKFNKNQMGYYRINYPAEMWGQLTEALINSRGVFSGSDRGHLIDDAFSLANAAQLDYDIALDLTKYLEKELDFVPWTVAINHLGSVINYVYYTELYRDLIVYARKLIQNVYEVVTWDVGTDHLQNLLRVDVLNAACAFGHKGALAEAAKRLKLWLSNPAERPNPDIRSVVYNFGMQETGNEQIWNQVWDIFVGEQNAQEKLKLMSALAAIREPWLLQRYINLAGNESYVRGQDYFSCLQLISKNRVGQSLVWDYVRENWLALVDRFGINERYLGRLIPSITRQFSTRTKLEEMETFFQKYPEAGAGTAARKQALETVKFNIKWLELNKQKVGKWLQAQSTGDQQSNR